MFGSSPTKGSFGKTILLGLIGMLVFNPLVAETNVAYGSNSEVGRYADINSVRIYYEVYGSGEPLLLLHGNGASISSFRFDIPVYAEHFTVIAVDSRAHGKSTDAPQPLSYKLLASDMAALLDHLDVASTYVLGASDGGIVGLEIAHAYPEKISKLVALAANFRPGDEILPNLDEQLSDPFDKTDGSLRMKELAKFVASMRLDSEPASPQEGKTRDKLENLMDIHPTFEPKQVSSIQTPTLVIAGDHDIIPEDHTLDLFRLLPHAHLSIVPGTTHAFSYEKPEITRSIILDFLQSPYYDVDRYYLTRKEKSE